MPLAAGTRLGPYEIVAAIGAGGMGEVYRATDTNLKRAVALKVLPGTVAAEPERLTRFQREAEVLAALNHPNIAAIYGLERSSGTTALVMELVEGPTLADRISRGVVPLAEALTIAQQIAEALEAAHERGIVHRDLKPANVKVRGDGTVKVLDFGLAKALDEPSEVRTFGAVQRDDLTDALTVTSPAQMTGVGTILGTAAYMAPEQARGRVIDKRADIWAFGVVLYEMTTGRRLFEGHDVTDIIALVASADPDVSLAPPAVQALLKKCLQKDPKRRLRDIADWSLLVESVAAHRIEAPRSRVWPALSALSLLVALVAVAGAFQWRNAGTVPAETRARVVLPAGLEVISQVAVAVSPNGNQLVFAATRGNRLAGTAQLFVWSRDSIDAQPLTGTEGARGPFWSPDGRSVAFRAGQTLKRVDLTGGVPQTIVGVGVSVDGGAWSHDGVILFGNSDGGISRVPAAGGDPVALTIGIKNHELHHEAPVFLPDGRHFLYARHAIAPDAMGIYVGSIDAVPADQPATPLLLADDGPDFVTGGDGRSGYVLFQRRGALLAQLIDTTARELRGEPITVAVGAAGGNIENLFAVSTLGEVIVYRPSGTADVRRTLVWVDRNGQQEPLALEPMGYEDPIVSPDGTRVAFTVTAPEGRNIWIGHVARETLMRLTFGAGMSMGPLWTRDGVRVVFNRVGEGLISKLANGTGPEEKVGTPGGAVFGWGMDGRMVWATPGLGDIGVIEPGGERRALLTGTFSERAPAMSPDGRWMAYESDESGRFEIYVRPYPNVDDGKWQISSGGGTQARWSPTGSEIFFVAPNQMAVVKVDTSSGFLFERPTPLFPTQSYAIISRIRSYDVSADGKRLLMLVEAGGTEGEVERADLVMIQNWRPRSKN